MGTSARQSIYKNANAQAEDISNNSNCRPPDRPKADAAGTSSAPSDSVHLGALPVATLGAGGEIL